MKEIRFHGRGGQGTVVASIVLAKAFFKSGFYVQTFPVFGVERRGAPVEAYLRLDTQKIRMRCNVYTPDDVVVQDRRLLEGVDVTRGLKPEGWILMNAPQRPKDLSPFRGFRLAWVDAGRVAVKHGLGTRTQPIINTAMAGALAKLMPALPLDALAAAIQSEIAVKPQQNIAAAREAFDAVHCHGWIA